MTAQPVSHVPLSPVVPLTDLVERETIDVAPAPVVGWDGEAIGALSVADHRETFSRGRIAPLGAAVRDAAATVSRQLLNPRAEERTP